MQDTILRVFVVAAGLIIYPRENLRSLNQDDEVAIGMQGREDWLLKESERLDQENALINQEVPEEDQDESTVNLQQVKTNEPQVKQGEAHTDQDHSPEGLEDTQVRPTVVEKVTEEKYSNVIEVHQYTAVSDLSLSPMNKGELETNPKPLTIKQEQPQGQKETKIDVEDSYIDNGQFSLDNDIPSIKQTVSLEVQNNGGPSGINIPPVNQEVVQTNKEVPQESQIHLPNILPEPTSFEGQQDVVEVLQEDKEASHMFREPSKTVRGGEKQVTDTENESLWYLWNTYSIISMIHFFIKYFRKKTQMNQSKDLPHENTNMLIAINLSTEVSLPDSDTLNCLYDKCVKLSPNDSWRVREFVEGFANDLLEAMRSMSDRVVGMAIEDFVTVEGVSSSLVYDIMVPITPLNPYSFQYQLWGTPAGDVPANMEGCGRIRIEQNVEKQNGCPCGYSNAEDVLCLLHSENEKVVEIGKEADSSLWSTTAPYLSKIEVLKWFQRLLRQAWDQTSHKYEFELIFCNPNIPGALMVRFRSGKVIAFDIKPVVKFKDTDAYFTIPTSTTNKDNCSDTFWALSLAPYEERFLKQLSKSLPERSCHLKCLEIAVFLHRKQTGLTGRSCLTEYHLKIVLLHLLLVQDPSMWQPEQLTNRLRDLFSFLENCLQHRKLCHALMGNPLVLNTTLPREINEAKPVNLFHPLVVKNSLFTKTVRHFYELLKNSSVLIQEYVPKECNGIKYN